jgi:flagellar hook-associated protein 3 FlgL
VRERAVQAGNTVLADSDRQAIASELETRLDELLGIANSRNAEGDYLFSGYQGATKPFVRGTTVSYLGDDGERLLQVTESQQMATSIPGSELFMNIREGNGSFATAAGGNGPGLANQGSGVIEAGSVLDPQRWQSALNDDSLWQAAGNRGLQIRFSSPGGVSSYQIFDSSTPLPLAGATPLGPELPFAAGQAIPQLATDFGLQVVINGMPAAGDTFAIRPSANKSVFQTVQEMVTRLRSPLASSTARTEYTAQMQGHLANLDQALTNVSRVQTVVGARMRSLDALSSNSEALGIQYQQALTALDGLDYAKAISDFTLQQVTLEAAQKSFVAISGLSLFKYI